ncbi:type I-E CRISPR-associated protein Cas7/Cse4/CasC [Calidithermus roseus]|uniref:CRISPR system Cascade subunit CasC n=1 Tax=Calidithermus roseus TaxID=1644118 RepID=A0A399F0E6_9DEIN|nr:type I-E CRISPR-associated protein Cas7/Cse4/CasC [Calidithermus roseus]RIH89450.1 CRISPR system Cascade subunit CasC [Calidithermus roseus]
MKHLLEIHILQNFAPSNLNRDDTGSPKDAFFGGYRRGRISSQCLKRAAREYVRDHPNGLPHEAMALRTKRLVQALVEQLKAKGRGEEEARQKVEQALGGMGLKVDAEGKTQYLLFLGKQEVAKIADLIDRHWDGLVAAQAEEEGGKKKAKDAKKAAREAVPDEIKKALGSVLDGGKALDVALFGRMLADLPEKNQDAACQVAHAISTNVVEREFDFYTAVDDLKPDDNSGADMLGTVEFNSACFYRYAAIDLEKLRTNLGGDSELMLKGLEAFLRAIVKAKPSGKQNSFAAHNDPEYVVFTVRQDADPRNLANAFEKPVRPSQGLRLTEASAVKFEQKWRWLEVAYGEAGKTFRLNAPEIDEADFRRNDKDENKRVGEPVESLRELIEKTLEAVRQQMGV